MIEKKNNIRRNYFYLTMVVAVISIFVFFQTQINSKIANHPKVVEMETNQKYTQKKLDSIDKQLEMLNRKIDKLLREEYP